MFVGGAGSIAVLIGPNAPIVMEIPRSSHFENVYDFYKPIPSKYILFVSNILIKHNIILWIGSEYPVVDGNYSFMCYLRALENCYERLKVTLKNKYNEPDFTMLNSVDYCLFHCPFVKMIRKAFHELVYIDIKYIFF